MVRKLKLRRFLPFWKTALGIKKVSQYQPNSKKVPMTTPNIYVGDILVENQASKGFSSLMYVLDVKEDENSNLIYNVLKVPNEAGLSKPLSVNISDIANKTSLLQFSNIAYNSSNYYNLIFKKLLGNQNLFVKLILSCCPETKKIDGKTRNNAYVSLFSVVSFKELQDEIKKTVLNGNCIVDPSSSIVESFVSTVFFGYKPTEDKQLPSHDEIVKIINTITSGNVVSGKKVGISQPIVNRFLRGETQENIDAFFKDKSNRKLFQERFSLVLQFYLLLNCKMESTQWCFINSNCPEIYNGATSSVIEYVTLSSLLFEKITHMVNYFSNYYLDAGVYVDSLFALAGCVFDSVGITFEDNQLSTYEEFGRFRELAKCYGARTLDYYFALIRYKDVNHFAASELANVYYFGWEFEGYKIEKDTKKAMELLNSCKDFSVDARWSLGENYKRLSDRYLKLINKYSITSCVSEEKNKHTANGVYSDDFQECLEICNIDYGFLNDNDDAYISDTICHRLMCLRSAAIEKSRSLYLGCGEYPPALNSLANILKDSLLDLVNKKTDTNECNRLAIDVINYYVKAASSGWVYSFNNLYSMLSNSSIMRVLVTNDEGRKIVKKAYSILKEDNITSSKAKEQFDLQKKELISGAVKELTSYQGMKFDVLFKYMDPLETPINFLVLAAFFDNLYGMNHLGVEYIKTGKPYYLDLAQKLFECAAKYGPWGHYNIGMYIYANDENNKIRHLKIASDMGLKKATDELESIYTNIEQGRSRI